MKLVAVVVTYYPNMESIVSNIEQYISDIDHLIIWENTPIQDRDKYLIRLPQYDYKISYLGTQQNEGIAYALNRSLEWGIDNGYSHILTMDQDSFFCDFKNYKEEVVKYSNALNMVFGPNPNCQYKEDRDLVEVPDVITSGCICDLSVFQLTGLFREDYFIDAVDLEFCIRVRQKGLNIYVLPHCHLIQEYGTPFVGIFGIETPNYSVSRTYYIIRNHIWMWREYPNWIAKQTKRRLIKRYIRKRFISICLVEPNKYQKLKSMFKGVYHGLTKKNKNEA